MNSLQERKSVRMVLFLAVVYLLLGMGFAELARESSTNPAIWRRLAWVFSAVAFAGHIGYEQFRLGNPGQTVATHVSFAAALGALGLAVSANVHELLGAASYRGRLAVALVAWPVLIAIPAFVVAMVATAVLKRWSRRSKTRHLA